MDLFQTLILALIQGLSEFLPISSSAHLILPAQIFGWPDQGLAFDVAVHLGSLAAVVVYFRNDLIAITQAWLSSLIDADKLNAVQQENAQLGWKVIIATLPVIVIALFAKDFIAESLRTTLVIAITTIVFGVLLGLAELKSRKQTHVVELSIGLALLIGLAQGFALIPGTSRSGVTITAAILLGLSRTEAARFSFLLSIPVILAAGLFLVLELIAEPQVYSWFQLGIAVVVSAISAWMCIALFLKFIERVGLMPFVWYRLILGGILIMIAFFGIT